MYKALIKGQIQSAENFERGKVGLYSLNLALEGILSTFFRCVGARIAGTVPPPRPPSHPKRHGRASAGPPSFASVGSYSFCLFVCWGVHPLGSFREKSAKTGLLAVFPVLCTAPYVSPVPFCLSFPFVRWILFCLVSPFIGGVLPSISSFRELLPVYFPFWPFRELSAVQCYVK